MAYSSRPDFAAVTDAVAKLQGRRRELEDTIERARRERDEIISAPASNADVIADINAALDREQERAPDQFKNLIDNLRNMGIRDPDRNFDPWSYLYQRHEKIAHALVPLLAQQIREALAKLVSAQPEPEGVGLPYAERVKKVAALDKQIDQAEAELAELREHAKRAGVNLKSSMF